MEMISARMLHPSHKPQQEIATTASREEVGGHISACAGGVARQIAQQRTKAFYRSSGHRWSLAL